MVHIERIILFYPVGDLGYGVLVRPYPAYDFFNTGVYYHPSTHRAGCCVGQYFPCLGVEPCKVKGGTDAVLSCGGYNSVRLRMDAAAELISLTAWYMHFISQAFTKIYAVALPLDAPLYPVAIISSFKTMIAP